MKKVKSVFLGLLVLLVGFMMVGCKNYDYTVGILQIVTHSALNDAREGFLEELARHGLEDGKNMKVIYHNPEGNLDDLKVMAADLVRKCDLVLGIATPAAVALQAAAKTEGKNIPILFTAVTDPVGEKLVESSANPGGNITGTSDMNPVTEQVELIKELLPEMTTLGIIYTVSERNSQVQAEMAEEAAQTLGLNVKVRTVEGITDISQVVQQLISDGMDALYVPTDNNLAKNLSIVTQITNEAKIPILASEEGQLENGGAITYSISYKELGAQTGAMAIKILLEGKAPSTLPVETQGPDKMRVVVNEEVLNLLEIELPQSIRDRLGSN